MILDEKTTREALKCCADNKDRCSECPLGRLITCKEQLIISVSDLVNQLDKDIERLRADNDEICDNICCLEIDLENARVHTVRKMQKEIEARCLKGGIYPSFVKSTIDKVAEEMLGETDVGIS